MHLIYHTTKLGNSFNIVLRQEVLWQEYGVSSVYTEADNFWSLFTPESRPRGGYVGDTSPEEEIDQLRDLPDRVLCRSLLSHPIDEWDFHERQPGATRESSWAEAREDLAIISAGMAHVALTEDQIKQDGVLILNRGHKFGLPEGGRLKIKHQDALRERLTISREHFDSQSIDFRGFRARHDFLVAVHLRKTDYAQYMGGRFFYSDEQYAAVCRRIKELVGDVGFVAFSDAPVDMSYFDGLDLMFNNGSVGTDIAAMTLCDCIVGPPSSFANCASFLGRTRRISIRNVEQFLETFISAEKIVNRRWFPHVG